ncbi:MAG: 2-(1,2-epoxy,2-dihydrophenyl)acetyl-CoA isomerase [Nocardioidaceae bacterium]|nr:2-(1,2-epoxy,2-dihydrophenyl)acetyl-CoA isomerase [Nocardioidaceae bacterium]
MTDDALALTVDDGVAHATLSRPERGNAFDLALCDAILALATRCDEDEAVRCLLVTSTGKWFSTGGDLAKLGESREGGPAFVERATRSLHAGIALLARMDAPVVVAMRGGAIGAGVALPAAADFCLVTERVRFLAGYPAIGMTVDAGLSYYLPRRVGSRAAADYFLRNRTWSADEAVRLGLATEIVPDDELDDRALDLARELAAGPTAAYGEVRRLLLEAADRTLEAQLDAEALALARATRTDDGWGGITAALAGERPHFSGR